jgi:hypothetical protein
MNREMKRFLARNDKKAFRGYAPVRRKREKEDSHVAFLWSKVQGGMQIEFYRNGEPTMSRRTLAKLISLQERAK